MLLNIITYFIPMYKTKMDFKANFGEFYILMYNFVQFNYARFEIKLIYSNLN